jgi:hypothetical protein
MAGASSSAHARSKHKTETLSFQMAPNIQEGAVARLRIVNVGSAAAARSGSTIPIAKFIQQPSPSSPHGPRAHRPERPQVIYTREIRTIVPPSPASHHARRPEVDTVVTDRAVFDQSMGGESLTELQLRAARALSGLQAGLRLHARYLPKKLSSVTMLWSIAVGVYALALFLIAVFTG